MTHFNRVFHYKPSILGYPYFWKHPNLVFGICTSYFSELASWGDECYPFKVSLPSCQACHFGEHTLPWPFPWGWSKSIWVSFPLNWAPNSIWRTDLLLRHLLVDPVLVMTSTMKLMMWNRPASCHVCDLRDLRLKVSRGVVLCEELFDMLDVEEKGTLTQTEFADGLLHLLTPLGFLDTTKSTNAGLGPFCPSRWGFSQLTVPVVFC